MLTIQEESIIVQSMVINGSPVQEISLLIKKVNALSKGESFNEHARTIQDRVIAIRESLDVIEGNLIDYVDKHTA